MALSRTFFTLSALVAVPFVYGQGVITSAQGTTGSPASLPLQIDLTKADANIINATEITANVVNECGRTLFGGNIDVGANTETQLANNTVTSVTKGSKVAVTIKQGDANGAGPYSCDLDLTSNSNGVSGQTSLNVTESDGANGAITLSVTLPSDLACTGASTGNVCTVRCFNKAATGPFGGCFAVKQTDVTAKANTPNNIATEQTLAGVQAQVLQNLADLPQALSANAKSGGTDAEQGIAAVSALLSIDSTAKATVAAASSATATAATKKNSSKSTSTSSAKSTSTSSAKANSKSSGKNSDNSGKNNNKRQNGLYGRQMRWGERSN